MSFVIIPLYFYHALAAGMLRISYASHSLFCFIDFITDVILSSLLILSSPNASILTATSLAFHNRFSMTIQGFKLFEALCLVGCDSSLFDFSRSLALSRKFPGHYDGRYYFIADTLMTLYFALTDLIILLLM
jgi:hypothetical protein